MVGTGCIVIAVLHVWSAVSSALVSSSGNLWARIAILDEKTISSVSSNVYYDVTHPITCMAKCPQNGTCGGFFYSESEAKCVTCPFPCKDASLVTGSGFRYYRHQRPVLQCPTQKGYYHYDDTDVCLKVYRDKRTRYDAQLFCQLDGGHLFDFNTEQEFDNLRDYLLNVTDAASLGGTGYYWVGATDEVTEGVWLWTDGTLATDMVVGKFDFNQPDGGTSQNGLIMSWSLKVHDRDHLKHNYFICETDLV